MNFKNMFLIDQVEIVVIWGLSQSQSTFKYSVLFFFFLCAVLCFIWRLKRQPFIYSQHITPTGTIDFHILWYLKFSPSFPPQRICIKRLFRVVISPFSCSLSFGIFQGTEAENKGEEDGRLPSQFWCLVKRKESDCAARFLLTDRRRADAD